MRSRYLPVICTNSDHMVRTLAPQLTGHLAPAWAFQRLCNHYRIRGAATFLLSAHPGHLYKDLQRSATAHAHFLEVAQAADKVTGRAAPFFDAVACGDQAAARRIALQSTADLDRNRELPEDYWYVKLLMSRFCLDGSPGEQAFLTTRFKASLEGGESARFDVSQALLKKDAEAFEVALAALIDEHRDFHETGLRDARIPEERWAVEGCLFIEGLALVRLAQAAGIPVAGGYPLIPSLAMPLYKLPYDPEAWRAP
jgi:Immunity protein 49